MVVHVMLRLLIALPAIVRSTAATVLVLALAGVPVSDSLRMLRIRKLEHLEAVLICRDEHVWPADFVVVREVVPVGGPCADGNVDVLCLARLPRLEIPHTERCVLVLRLRHCITTIRRRREGVRDVHPEARDSEE